MDSLSVYIGVCAIELNVFAAFYECILHFDFDHNQIEKFWRNAVWREYLKKIRKNQI